MRERVFLLLFTAICFIPSVAFETVYVNQIYDFVSSQDMDGMTVEVTFDHGSTMTQTWERFNTDSSGVTVSTVTDIWSLENSAYNPDPNDYIDDTGRNHWKLYNESCYFVDGDYFENGITSLTINGITAGIVFDIIGINSYIGTPGSGEGWWDGNDGNVGNNGIASFGSGYIHPKGGFTNIDYNDEYKTYNWEFSQPVALKGQSETSPNDVWGAFTINFHNPFIGMLEFDLDTDAASVPEPAT